MTRAEMGTYSADAPRGASHRAVHRIALAAILPILIAVPAAAMTLHAKVQAALTGRIAIAVFNGGVVEYSTDDGATWTVVNSGTTADLRRGTCPTPTDCYTVGSNGVIIKSTDAGRTWKAQTSGTTTFLKDVWFADAGHGLIPGQGGLILTTVDAGVHWVRQTSGTSVTLRNGALPTTSNGYVVGDNGVILASTDGGVHWHPQSSGTTASLAGVSFVDALTGAPSATTASCWARPTVAPTGRSDRRRRPTGSRASRRPTRCTGSPSATRARSSRRATAARPGSSR